MVHFLTVQLWLSSLLLSVSVRVSSLGRDAACYQYKGLLLLTTMLLATTPAYS